MTHHAPILTMFCWLNLQSDEVATAWLNNESVRSAIHAEPVWQTIYYDTIHSALS
jgi:hypothetical protein